MRADVQPDRGAIDVGPGVVDAGRALLFARLARRTRAARDERGQAITEFAMVLPLIAGLAFVLIMCGKLVFNYIQLTHAANEGARLASVNQPGSGTLCGVLHSSYTVPSGATVTVSYPNSTENVGDPVKVNVQTSSGVLPFIPSFTLAASATMRLEQTVTSPALTGPPCST